MDRRAFLKEATALTVVPSGLNHPPRSAPASSAAPSPPPPPPLADYLGWKPHWLKQGDGEGGWVLRPAQIQFLHWPNGKLPYYDPNFKSFCPYGVAQMDNSEVVLIGDANHGDVKVERPAIAFSRDGGNTWTELKLVDESEECRGRPIMLTYLGKGNLMFQTETKTIIQFFSKDYGRTWPERRPLQLASNGSLFNVEGNALVDRDASGMATRIAAIGYNYPKGTEFPVDPAVAMLRWSTDGGRTWTNETRPNWRWEVKYQGKTYVRGTGEGSIIRAANGWLIAALRTDTDPKFIPLRNDNLMGIGVSISKDEGATWTPVKRLYDAGRMHMHLLRLSGGAIVMTHIARQDIQKGELVSYRRGCGAVISYDNGLTWDMAHRYLLDDFEFADGTPHSLACGHQYSTLLDDGHILTCYGNYVAKGACLIRWKPTPP